MARVQITDDNVYLVGMTPVEFAYVKHALGETVRAGRAPDELIQLYDALVPLDASARAY